MVKPAQIRAARSLLGWSQDELALQSKVSRSSVARIERGDHLSFERTLEDLVRRLEAAGIRFISDDWGSGVILQHDAEGDTSPRD